VTVCDPLPDVAERVRAGLREITPTLAPPGLSVDELTDSTDALRFDPDAASAVAGTDVVQENGPERPEGKQQLWSAIEAGAAANALLASSSSSIPATVMEQAMRQPGRLVVGHPFNPPHRVPLVEVVPSPGTDPEVVEAAVAFYRAMGKQPQVLSREIPGSSPTGCRPPCSARRSTSSPKGWSPSRSWMQTPTKLPLTCGSWGVGGGTRTPNLLLVRQPRIVHAEDRGRPPRASSTGPYACAAPQDPMAWSPLSMREGGRAAR
jgi:3-hydroxyacyl-CoA dehydrogenase, NAD binding domain